MPISTRFVNPQPNIAVLEVSSSARQNSLEAATFNGLNSLDDDVNTAEATLALIASGTYTFAGAKTFSTVPKTTGGDPGVSTDLTRKSYVDGKRHLYFNMAPPAYATNQTITVPWYDVRSSNDSVDFANMSSSTVTLAAAVSISVNGIATDETVGANKFYNLYAIFNSSTSVTRLMFSSKNVAGGDTLTGLPSGYNFSRQAPFCVLTDASSHIIPFYIGSGWPRRPTIAYNVALTQYDGTYNTGSTNVLNAGTSGTFTDVDLSGFVPPISRLALLSTYTSGGNFSLRPADESHDGIGFGSNDASAHGTGIYEIRTDSTQKVSYKHSNGSTTGAYLDVARYIVTEVL